MVHRFPLGSGNNIRCGDFVSEAPKSANKRLCFFLNDAVCDLDVSKNSGTPKSSILIGFSIINHPLRGTPIFGNTHFFPRCTHFIKSPVLTCEEVKDDLVHLCNKKLAWISAPMDAKEHVSSRPTLKTLRTDLWFFGGTFPETRVVHSLA